MWWFAFKNLQIFLGEAPQTPPTRGGTLPPCAFNALVGLWRTSSDVFNFFQSHPWITCGLFLGILLTLCGQWWHSSINHKPAVLYRQKALCWIYTIWCFIQPSVWQGDPNVPAGEVSLKVDLTRPMVLNRDQQRFIDTLRKTDISGDAGTTQPQPFQVPADCSGKIISTPASCIARWVCTKVRKYTTSRHIMCSLTI